MNLNKNLVQSALYPGSFDPFTYGHLDVVAAGLKLFDRVFVAVGIHEEKFPLFSPEERISLIENSIKDLDDYNRVRVVSFTGLMIESAKDLQVCAVLRGVRNSVDLDYEMRLDGINRTLAPEITTVFIPASPAHAMISSTLLRQIASMGGDVCSFVPENVAVALKSKFTKNPCMEKV